MHQHHPLRSPFSQLSPSSPLLINFPQLSFFSTDTFRAFSLVLPSIFPSFSFFFSLSRAHRHFDTEEIYFHPKFNPNLQPNCASQIDTAHRHQIELHIRSTHSKVGLEVNAQIAKVVQLGTFFLVRCSHTQSLFFSIPPNHDIGKSSFHCQPDNANVCCVVAFLPSIHWVRFFFPTVRWKAALGHAQWWWKQQNNPGENYDNIYFCMDDVLGDPQLGAKDGNCVRAASECWMCEAVFPREESSSVLTTPFHPMLLTLNFIIIAHLSRTALALVSH